MGVFQLAQTLSLACRLCGLPRAGSAKAGHDVNEPHRNRLAFSVWQSDGGGGDRWRFNYDDGFWCLRRAYC